MTKLKIDKGFLTKLNNLYSKQIGGSITSTGGNYHRMDENMNIPLLPNQYAALAV